MASMGVGSDVQAGNPYSLAVSPAGTNAGDLYLAVFNGNNPGTVAVFDSTNSLIDTITVGNGPTGLAIAP